MHDFSSPEDETEKQNCQCLNKISNFLTGSLEKGFYRSVEFYRTQLLFFKLCIHLLGCLAGEWAASTPHHGLYCLYIV